jgi:hypothetical protein
MDPGSALAYQNIPGFYYLTAKAFYPASFPGAIAAIARTAPGFFMCQGNPSCLIILKKLYSNFLDLQSGVKLAVAAFAAISLTSFHFEDQDLFAFALANNPTHHFGPLDLRLADLEFLPGGDH